MVENTVEVKNSSGLHARPASLFVQTAGKFTCNIWISKDGRGVNAKSIMGIMSLAVGRGSLVTIGAEGEDEEQAVKELVDVVSNEYVE